MPRVIIADANCLILLEKIGALHLLHQLYGQLLMTDTVAAEYGLSLPTWVVVQAVQNARQVQVLALTLDPGEVSAIALALKQPECLLIIDEQRARGVAQQLGLAITGSLGVLLEAKKKRISARHKTFIGGNRGHKFSPQCCVGAGRA